MHRVGSAGNTANSVRPRKEKRLTYVLNDADDTKVRLLVLILYQVGTFLARNQLDIIVMEKG